MLMAKEHWNITVAEEIKKIKAVTGGLPSCSVAKACRHADQIDRVTRISSTSNTYQTMLSRVYAGEKVNQSKCVVNASITVHNQFHTYQIIGASVPQNLATRNPRPAERGYTDENS